MEVRERILLKANELFSRYGFRRVTMDEIALKTGMSKKTIYQSFANKDEIVDGVVETHINKCVDICEQNGTNAENAIQEIFLNIEMLQDLTSEMEPAVFEELEKFFPSAFQKLYLYKHDVMYKKIKQNIERGIEEGLYRAELNTDIITKLRIEAMFIPFNQSVFPAGRYSIIDVEKESLQLFLYGLSTAEGQKLIKKYKQYSLKNKLYE